jgi:hypothetical protein
MDDPVDGAGTLGHHLHRHNQAWATPPKRVKFRGGWFPVETPIAHIQLILLHSGTSKDCRPHGKVGIGFVKSHSCSLLDEGVLDLISFITKVFRSRVISVATL